MKLDKKTKLFVNLTEEEAEELYRTARAIILEGKVPSPAPAWLKQWVKKAGLPDTLLTTSTVLPQYLLLSVGEFVREEMESVHEALAKLAHLPPVKIPTISEEDQDEDPIPGEFSNTKPKLAAYQFVFDRAMRELQFAEDDGGSQEDYLALMEAIKAEVEGRIATAKANAEGEQSEP